MKKIDESIKKQSAVVAAAKAEQAVGSDFAADYIEIKGIRFYRHTLAHLWLFNRLRGQHWPSATDLGVCLGYILAHEQDTVRNRLMAEVNSGELLGNAYSFAIDHNLQPGDYDRIVLELGSELLVKVEPEKEKTDSKNV